jgi:hypothetical protein
VRSASVVLDEVSVVDVVVTDAVTGAGCAETLACFLELPPPQPASSSTAMVIAMHLTPRWNTYTGAE